MALTVGQFAAMRLRGTEQGVTGTLHLVEGMVAMLLIFTAMGIAATAFGTRFRLYTIATIVLALGFGAWSGVDSSEGRAGPGDPLGRGQGAHLLVRISIVVHRAGARAAPRAGRAAHDDHQPDYARRSGY